MRGGDRSFRARLRVGLLTLLDLPSRAACVVETARLTDRASPVDVCLTTYGGRTASVWAAIRSIGRGRARPRRIILWLDDQRVAEHPPLLLRRLSRRGLEIRHSLDFGPHKKYYPYVLHEWDGRTSMVTADDDVIYPRDWLEGLLAARASDPSSVVAHRAHLIAGDGEGRFLPYERWRPARGRRASFAVFGTGMGGILYPPAALRALRAAGDGFMQTCLYADDIWIHLHLVRAGLRTRVASGASREFRERRGTQSTALWASNLTRGRNDRYIAAMYRDADRQRVLGDREATTST